MGRGIRERAPLTLDELRDVERLACGAVAPLGAAVGPNVAGEVYELMRAARRWGHERRIDVDCTACRDEADAPRSIRRIRPCR